MKKIIFVLFSVSTFNTLFAQNNIGISNNLPTEKLHIDSGGLKIGKLVWNINSKNYLRFGDGEFIHIGEQGDDSLVIRSKYIALQHYTPGSSTRVNIDGKLSIADGTQGINKVLTSDANGLASWKSTTGSGFDVSSPSTPISFSTSNTPLLIAFNNEDHDLDNSFNTGTYKYVVPTTGLYQFNTNLNFVMGGQVGSYLQLAYIKYFTSGLEYNLVTHEERRTDAVGGLISITLSGAKYLLAGTTVYVTINTTIASSSTLQKSSFSGFRIY